MRAGRLASAVVVGLVMVCGAAAAASANASSASFRTDSEAAAFQSAQHNRRLQTSPRPEDRHTARVRRRPCPGGILRCELAQHGFGV
jgi:hypothetical protein